MANYFKWLIFPKLSVFFKTTENTEDKFTIKKTNKLNLSSGPSLMNRLFKAFLNFSYISIFSFDIFFLTFFFYLV